MPLYDILECDPLLDSADMDVSDWVKIATRVEENYFDYDGFVVITGTDTMVSAIRG
jgi:L-asparaginase/Glu-tRNA(Gln) amidotransferase subunit D